MTVIWTGWGATKEDMILYLRADPCVSALLLYTRDAFTLLFLGLIDVILNGAERRRSEVYVWRFLREQELRS